MTVTVIKSNCINIKSNVKSAQLDFKPVKNKSTQAHESGFKVLIKDSNGQIVPKEVLSK